MGNIQEMGNGTSPFWCSKVGLMFTLMQPENSTLVFVLASSSSVMAARWLQPQRPHTVALFT